MFGLGTSEILVILIVALVVFGKRLPEVARSVGTALSEFRRGLSGLQREFQDEISRADRPASSAGPAVTPPAAGSQDANRPLKPAAEERGSAPQEPSKPPLSSSPEPVNGSKS